MSDDLDRLEELAKVATPGPWRWWTSNSWKRLRRDDRRDERRVLEPYVCSDGHPDISIDSEDMAYIAAANPAAILALIERVRKAEAGRPIALEREIRLQATLAERERCAKVAEDAGFEPVLRAIDGHQIAARIREGK